MQRFEPELRDTVAITGVSRGIGRALAERLGERGCLIFGCARSPAEPAPRLTSFQADIRVDAEVGSWVKSVSAVVDRVDVLIHNAAILGERAPILEISSLVWADVLATNILGTASVTKEFFPLLERGREPLILFVGSVSAHLPRAGLATYSVTKAAQQAFAISLAQELSLIGIRVCTLVPGRVATNLRRRGYGNEERPPDSALEYVLQATELIIEHRASIPTGSILGSEDIPFWFPRGPRTGTDSSP